MKSIPLFIVMLIVVGCSGPTKRCLVSPLSGTIVTNGMPVEGATVTRSYYSHWYDKQVVTVTQTDANGDFKFDGVWKKVLVGALHQPVIEEEMIVELNGKKYKVFNVIKMDYDTLSEISLDKKRLSQKAGKLYFKFDLDLEKSPIGRPQ